MSEIDSLSPSGFVRSLYGAIEAGDAAGAEGLVDAYCSEDVYVEWPPSVPHGGRLEGRGRVARLFRRAATPTNGAGSRNVRLTAVAGGDDAQDVVALLSFDWVHPDGTATPTGAAEHWTFRGGRAISVRAYYYDTDAVNGVRR